LAAIQATIVIRTAGSASSPASQDRGAAAVGAGAGSVRC
jgi:hypothetical protein